MDYEDKYKQALKRAKTILELTDNPKEANGYVSTIFPELCEKSEDEKIRKAIIEEFQVMAIGGQEDKYFRNGVKIKDAISWLEKQGEQKSADWSEEDEKIINNIDSVLDYCINHFPKGSHTVYHDYKDWLKSLKSCWKPSKEQMEELEYVTRGNSYPHLTSLYQDLKKL